MTGPERQALQTLRQQVAALQHQVQSIAGPGVSTRSGIANFRTIQIGFAANLTSTYNATTGYSWARQKLDVTVPGFVTPAVQPTGNQAFERTGNTSLGIGQEVWLEPSPDGSGYIFTIGGTSPPPPSPPTPATGGPFLAGATQYDCWTASLYSATGNMSGMPSPQSVRLSWDGVGWSTSGSEVWSTCLSSGQLQMYRDSTTGAPAAKIKGLGVIGPGGTGTGSGFTGDYQMEFVTADVGDQILYFDGGNSGTDTICCASETSLGPANNRFIIAIQWGSCTSPAMTCCTPQTALPQYLPITLVFTTADGLTTVTWSGMLVYNIAASLPNLYKYSVLMPGGTLPGCPNQVCVTYEEDLPNSCLGDVNLYTRSDGGAPGVCGGGGSVLVLPIAWGCPPNTSQSYTTPAVNIASFFYCSGGTDWNGGKVKATVDFSGTSGSPLPAGCGSGGSGSGSGSGGGGGGCAYFTSAVSPQLVVSGSTAWTNGTYAGTWNPTTHLFNFTVPGSANPTYGASDVLAFGYSSGPNEYVLGYSDGSVPWPTGVGGLDACTSSSFAWSGPISGFVPSDPGTASITA